MKIKVARLLIGGLDKGEVLVAPCWKGQSIREVTPQEGKAWLSEVRSKIHSATTLLAKGGPKLQAPSKMSYKNITRWAVGSSRDALADYSPVTELGVMESEDLWYFLDCEACVNAFDQILAGKKLANLPRALLDLLEQGQAYQVEECLAWTLSPSDESEEGIDHWESAPGLATESDSDSSSEEGLDGWRGSRGLLSYLCEYCREEYRAASSLESCPNCGNPS